MNEELKFHAFPSFESWTSATKPELSIHSLLPSTESLTLQTELKLDSIQYVSYLKVFKKLEPNYNSIPSRFILDLSYQDNTTLEWKKKLSQFVLTPQIGPLDVLKEFFENSHVLEEEEAQDSKKKGVIPKPSATTFEIKPPQTNKSFELQFDQTFKVPLFCNTQQISIKLCGLNDSKDEMVSNPTLNHPIPVKFMFQIDGRAKVSHQSQKEFHLEQYVFEDEAFHIKLLHICHKPTVYASFHTLTPLTFSECVVESTKTAALDILLEITQTHAQVSRLLPFLNISDFLQNSIILAPPPIAKKADQFLRFCHSCDVEFSQKLLEASLEKLPFIFDHSLSDAAVYVLDYIASHFDSPVNSYFFLDNP